MIDNLPDSARSEKEPRGRLIDNERDQPGDILIGELGTESEKPTENLLKHLTLILPHLGEWPPCQHSGDHHRGPLFGDPKARSRGIGNEGKNIGHNDIAHPGEMGAIDAEQIRVALMGEVEYATEIFHGEGARCEKNTIRNAKIIKINEMRKLCRRESQKLK